MIFSHWNKRVSVRTQRFRLDHQNKLFDMGRDPGQRRDVATEHSQIAAELTAAVRQWRDEMLPGLRDDERPIPVGYVQFPITLLPARDGNPEGKVHRSNKFPNSTYFCDWTSTEDRMTWDIEVANSGQYGVTLHYACPESDVGAVFELQFQDRRLRGQVTHAHDPPLIGPGHDRVPRAEGPMKNFQPLEVGTLDLPAGRGLLTLRALEIPGRQVMELRYVVLTLKTP